MTKNEILAKYIKELLDKKKMDIAAISGRLPSGFLKELSESIPSNLGFSTTHDSLAVYFSIKKGQNKRDILEILKKLYEDNDNITESAILSSESSLSTYQLTTDDVKKICDELIDKRLTDIEHIVHNEHIKLVPEAKIIKGQGKGRKYERKYRRVSITIDEELMKLFYKEVKKLKTAAPRLMDSILWERYGYPKLSFQDKEEKP